ncbi:MAG TPA: branched-chain amino acid ABC transporter permease [Candidatus Elarobacter sp.]|nr:branched-chain amino acid ABC transporter permease [Candidatus Elarobacter sp.]
MLQLLIAGLTVGSEYGLIALGIHIVLRATRVVNFAQGEFAIVGGLVALSCVESLHVSVWAALIAAVLAGAALGVAFELLVLRPAGRSGESGATIATIGTVFVLLYGHALVPGWGSDPHVLPAFTTASAATPNTVGTSSAGTVVSDSVTLSLSKGASPLVIPKQSLWVLALLALALVVLYAFFERTYFGKAIRAAADDPLGARLIGIDVRTTRMIAVALGIALAAYGGTIIGPITLVGGAGGFALTIKGFVGAILGGLDSAAGCVAGGLLVGVLESFLTLQLGSDAAEPVVYSLLLLMLLLRPQGLFGRRDAVRD